MRARCLTAILFAALFAPPAQAIRLDIVQTGGTAVGGSGGAGDTLILEVVATLDAGDTAIIVYPALQWDLEGGDVLDLVASSDPDYQLVNGVRVRSISPTSDIFSPLDVLGTLITFDANDAVYPSIAGPEAFVGLEQAVPPGGAGIYGPATFSIGTAEFVLNSGGSTEISFFTGTPAGTAIIDADFQVAPIDLGTFQVNPLATPVPEPGTRTLVLLGLLAMGAHRRSVRRRRTA
jgi:hypothetical protein